VLAALLVSLRAVLTPIAVAFVLAYICDPLVTRLERLGVRRLAAVIALYVLGAIVVLAVGFLLMAKTLDQVLELRENLGGYLTALRAWLAEHELLAAALSTAPAEPGRRDWSAELLPLVQQHGIRVANTLVGLLLGVFTSFLAWVSIFVLIPLYSFFLLWRFSDLIRTIREHLPAASRETIVYVASTINQAVASFFRGRLIVCLVIALVTGVGWTLVGVPYSLPLGALAGVLNLVPFMSLLALPPALLLTYLEHAGGNWAVPLVLTMAVYMLVQALESFVLSPVIEARASGLHPITTVLALLIGAEWAGLLGMLLAIPIASTLKTLAQRYLLPEIRRWAGLPPIVPLPAEAAAAPAAAPPVIAEETDDEPVGPAPCG
jgi:predicted PurR-regulated permease PerM